MKPESEAYVRIFCAALQGIMANSKIQDFWSLEPNHLNVIAESNAEAAMEIANTAIKKLSDWGVI